MNLGKPYDVSSAFFQYKFIFITELFLVETLIGLLFTKKQKFALRLAASVVCLLAITFAIPILQNNSIYTSLIFTVMFAFSLISLKVCYEEDWGNILFAGILAYCVQHTSYVFGNYITNMCGIQKFNLYGQIPFVDQDIRGLLINFGTYFGLLIVVLMLVLYALTKNVKIKIERLPLAIVAGAMLFVNVYCNAVVVYEFSAGFSRVILTILFVYDIICTLFILYCLYISMKNTELKEEINAVQELWEKDRKTYLVKKEYLETINYMCHDLRHEIRQIRKNGFVEEKMLRIESAIDKYDNVYHTGNPVLDIVMTEAAQYCEDNDIQFYCFTDTVEFGKLSEDILYSLFDNIVHNAIEATSKIQDKSKRYIKVLVSSRQGMATINVENSYNNESLTYVDGLPLSTNKESGKHGLGLKSIRQIVNTHNGGMNISSADGIFNLSILINIEN